jgi:hypothetical protein
MSKPISFEQELLQRVLQIAPKELIWRLSYALAVSIQNPEEPAMPQLTVNVQFSTLKVDIPALDRLMEYLDGKQQAALDSVVEKLHTENDALENATNKEK